MYTQFMISTNALNTTIKHDPKNEGRIRSLQAKRISLVLSMTEAQFKNAFTGGK